MARIAGVDLPRTKRIEIGLTYIYGIGRKRSNDILTAAGVSPDIRIKDLSEDDVRKINSSDACHLTLSLSLLVLLVRADHAHDPTAANDLALVTNALD